jgi:cellulose biosynthesis protein BcsQ
MMWSSTSYDGYRVLVVDLDPQIVSTSTLLGVNTSEHLPYTTLDLVDGPDGTAFTPHHVAERLDLVPGNQEQVGRLEHRLYEVFKDIQLFSGPAARRRVLEARLDDVEAGYDFVIMDCPTALGEVTSNAIEAADLIISPLDMENRVNVLSVSDLDQHVKTMSRQPPIVFIANKWAPARKQCRAALPDAQRLCGDRLLLYKIPACTAVPEALTEQRDVRGSSDGAAAASQAVWNLSQVVLRHARLLNERAAVAAGG